MKLKGFNINKKTTPPNVQLNVLTIHNFPKLKQDLSFINIKKAILTLMRTYLLATTVPMQQFLLRHTRRLNNITKYVYLDIIGMATFEGPCYNKGHQDDKHRRRFCSDLNR